MSLYIDHKFVAQVGARLERFKRKNQKTYNFRCPICHDSEKSKTKSRAYFYVRANDIYFKCHNCFRSWTLGTFLKEVDYKLYEQYIFERYANGENGHSNYAKPTFSQFNFKPDFSKNISGTSDVFTEYGAISSLPDTHAAKRYMLAREIPVNFLDGLYWCEDFKKLAEQFDPDSANMLKIGEGRIVIPFYDQNKKLIAFQGRSLSDKGLRYITIKVDKDALKLFGLDRVELSKRVYIFEGPIDSMFVPNSVATAGASISDFDLFPDRVFVYDNERRKPQIVDAMEKRAREDENVVVWPDIIIEKDINAMILAGKSQERIIDILQANTFQGLMAAAKIADWRRC